MKVKRIIILPVVIISVFLSTLCMSAFASDSEIIGGGDFPAYYPLEDIITNYAPEYAHSYFYINYEITTVDSVRTEHQPWTMFIPIRDNATYTNNNGIITIPREYLNPAYYHNFQYYFYSDGTLYSQDSPDFMFDGYSFSTDLVFNTGLNEISFNGMTLTSEIVYVDYDFADLKADSNSLNISVSFTPNMSGSIDRSYQIEGNEYYQLDFKMTVTNNSRVGCQYLMYVSEPGYTPTSFNELGNTNGASCTISLNSDMKFLFLSEEDAYLNQGNLFKSVCLSPWHLCTSGDTVTTTFYWNMLDLVADHQYDIVVYAMPNDYDAVSTIGETFGNFVISPESNKAGHTVDFSKVQQVYRSTFSVKNPAEYDPNATSGTAIANNNSTDYRGLTSQIHGYYDSNGKYTTANYNTLKQGLAEYYPSSGLKPTNHSNTNPYGSNKKYDTGTDYTTFLSNMSGAFSFISGVLGFFPTDIFVVLNISLWTSLFIIIIRRLH